jgi:hypothetical protein
MTRHFAWHLIVSLRDSRQPVLRAVRVRKDADEYGSPRTTPAGQ